MIMEDDDDMSAPSPLLAVPIVEEEVEIPITKPPAKRGRKKKIVTSPTSLFSLKKGRGRPKGSTGKKYTQKKFKNEDGVFGMATIKRSEGARPVKPAERLTFDIPKTKKKKKRKSEDGSVGRGKTKKGRGRPRKDESIVRSKSAGTGKRGRPKKDGSGDAPAKRPKLSTGPRGRPRKDGSTPKTPGKRGRPRKDGSTPRTPGTGKRGRPRKDGSTKKTPGTGKRGRPRKDASIPRSPTKSVSSSETSSDSEAESDGGFAALESDIINSSPARKLPPPKKPAAEKKKRGRPRKDASKSA